MFLVTFVWFNVSVNGNEYHEYIMSDYQNSKLLMEFNFTLALKISNMEESVAEEACFNKRETH